MESTTSGTGEVHAHLSSQPDKGEGMSGKFHVDDDVPAADRRAGPLSAARDYPIATLGIAFTLGFLLAGRGEPDRHPSVAKAKNQIKGAIVGGVSAAISQQLRTFIEDQGGIGSLLSIFGLPVSRAGDDSYARSDDELREL